MDVGLEQSSLRRLRLVQKVSARPLRGVQKGDHGTPVLASLRWLPVQFRIVFKKLLLVFQNLNGLAPSCLSGLHLHTPAKKKIR